MENPSELAPLAMVSIDTLPTVDASAPQLSGSGIIQVPHSRKSVRRLSDIALLNSEARYRRSFETAQDGILLLDARTGVILDVNPQLIALLEFSRAEFIGKALWESGPFKDIDECRSAFLELHTKPFVRYNDLILRTKHGRSITVEFVSTIFGVNRKKIIQCNIRDMTERKDIERSEAEQRQAQKMEAVGRLAGGIAHEFNNLLGVMLGYCELLMGRPNMTGEDREMLAHINDAGSSATQLTRPLLAFSRKRLVQPVFLDLNAAVERMSSMLGRFIGDDVELITALGADLGTIKADSSQVEQVLMNLVLNARDSMPHGGKITILTENVEIDDALVAEHPSLKPGPYVTLSVIDTGVGMDKETQYHIFEPFFTTKEFGRGTGLGLSTVFGIVKQSNAEISVKSERGRGTTFTVQFPRQEQAVTATPLKPGKVLSGGTETILLVDDATALRGLTKRLLEDCGYRVIDSGDPKEALRMALEHIGDLHLLITDVVMPGLSGPALSEMIAAVRPSTQVLYTSGYAEEQAVKQGTMGPDCTFLEKPFTRDQLLSTVRLILNSLAEAQA